MFTLSCPWSRLHQSSLGSAPPAAGGNHELHFCLILLTFPPCVSEITRIIQVDLDLKYKTNIRDLFDEFDNFPEGAVIGIAREMQPVYRYSSLPVGSREWAASGW